MSDTLRVTNISFGNVASNFNQAQLGFNYVGLGSTSNYAFCQFYGTTSTLCWTANGTVGVGTTNPSFKMDIWGPAVAGDVTRHSMLLLARPATSGVQNNVSSGFFTGANVITVAPYGVLDIRCNGLPVAGNTYGAIPDVTVMSIIGNGTVGIGKTNPAATLDVNGTISTNGTLTLNNSNFVKNGTTAGYYMDIQGGDTTNSPFINFFVNGTRRCYIGNATSTIMEIYCQNGAQLNFATESVYRMTITTAGNVGIGTTAPVGLLSVLLNGSGTYNPSTWTTSYALFGPGANSASGSAVGITYNTAGSYGSLISLSAGVAWRNMVYSANEHYFYVTGSLAGYVNAGGFVSVSDEREKINIKNINTERSLQRILSCTPKTFQRIMDRADPMIPDEVKNKWHIGLNAQEVLSINPHCISEWKNQDGEARYGINYTDFVTHLIGSIQEIVKQNTSQAELISVQDAKIATLQSRMDVLEALVAKPT